MQENFENGPPTPKNEAEEVGEALYLALKKLYADYPLISKSFTAQGSPKVFRIMFDNINVKSPEDSDDPLDEFQEDAAKIIASYNIPVTISISFAAEEYLGKIRQIITVSLKE